MIVTTQAVQYRKIATPPIIQAVSIEQLVVPPTIQAVFTEQLAIPPTIQAVSIGYNTYDRFMNSCA